jgi:hypothetical protein
MQISRPPNPRDSTSQGAFGARTTPPLFQCNENAALGYILSRQDLIAGLSHAMMQALPTHRAQSAMPETARELGDFTTSPQVITISALAVGIGIVSAFVALALLRLIGFFTNLFFYQRIGSALVSPANNSLGWLEIFVPIGGALIVGLMARYGSDRIRGHGIPEAIEAILINGSRIQPKVAILKPLSAAISIGSGGPFGAEGPIIMTGGAFGSMIAQLFKLTAAERKTLLVCPPPLARPWPLCCWRWSCCYSNGSRAA